MVDNVKIIDGGGTTSFIRAIGLAGGTYVMYSIPSRIDGTAYLAPATIASSMPVALPTDQIITAAITTAYWTTGIPTSSNTALTVAISPNGLNPNGSATSAGSAPTVIANDQAAIAIMQNTKWLANGNSTTVLAPSFAVASITVLGTATIVASNATAAIRVIALQMTNSTATNFKWQSGATDITGVANFTTFSGYVLPFNPVGWFQAAAGSALVANSSATSAVSGCLTYILV